MLSVHTSVDTDLRNGESMEKRPIDIYEFTGQNDVLKSPIENAIPPTLAK